MTDPRNVLGTDGILLEECSISKRRTLLDSASPKASVVGVDVRSTAVCVAATSSAVRSLSGLSCALSLDSASVSLVSGLSAMTTIKMKKKGGR